MILLSVFISTSTNVTAQNNPVEKILLEMNAATAEAKGCGLYAKYLPNSSNASRFDHYERFVLLWRLDVNKNYKIFSQPSKHGPVYVLSFAQKNSSHIVHLDYRAALNNFRRENPHAKWPNEFDVYTAELESILHKKIPNLKEFNRIRFKKGDQYMTLLRNGFTMSWPDKALLERFRKAIVEHAKEFNC